VRPSSAATSSNSSGVMWSSRWASSSPRGVLPGFVAVNERGSTGDVADPQRAHELQPWQPAQLVGMPLTKLRVLRCLADDGVLDDRIAEVVDHRSNGEHATQSFVQARLCHARPLLFVPHARAGRHVSGESTGGTWDRFLFRATAERNALLHECPVPGPSQCTHKELCPPTARVGGRKHDSGR